MRIESIETMVTRLPLLKGDWRDTIHHVTHIELILCEIRSDTGVVGTGISHTSGDGGKVIEAVIRHSLAPFLVGREISPRAVWHDAWHFLHDLGGAGVTTHALGAVDIALWDLVGRARNLPASPRPSCSTRSAAGTTPVTVTTRSRSASPRSPRTSSA
jgi:L-alanine-DL-glutamate epimerase-like enolase superfamily enzyme